MTRPLLRLGCQVPLTVTFTVATSTVSQIQTIERGD